MALGSLISLLQLTKVTNFEIDGFIYVGSSMKKTKIKEPRKEKIGISEVIFIITLYIIMGFQLIFSLFE